MHGMACKGAVKLGISPRALIPAASSLQLTSGAASMSGILSRASAAGMVYLHAPPDDSGPKSSAPCPDVVCSSNEAQARTGARCGAPVTVPARCSQWASMCSLKLLIW